MDVFYGSGTNCLNDRIALISRRLYEDFLYNTMLSTALEICKEISRYTKPYNLITFMGIRGSVIVGTAICSDDIDIIINSKKRKKVEKYIDKLCQRYDHRLKKICPQLTRAHVVSVYLPRTPQNPYHRHELFVNDPVDLEIRTTQAEQSIPYKGPYKKIRRKVYEFQTRYLKRAVTTTLKDSSADSFQIIETIRQVAMKEYDLDRDTAHNSTMISDARLRGLIFTKEEIQQNTIVLNRNKLLEERFEKEITEIKYWMGI